MKKTMDNVFLSSNVRILELFAHLLIVYGKSSHIYFLCLETLIQSVHCQHSFLRFLSSFIFVMAPLSSLVTSCSPSRRFKQSISRSPSSQPLASNAKAGTMKMLVSPSSIQDPTFLNRRQHVQWELSIGMPGSSISYVGHGGCIQLLVWHYLFSLKQDRRIVLQRCVQYRHHRNMVATVGYYSVFVYDDTCLSNPPSPSKTIIITVAP